MAERDFLELALRDLGTRLEVPEPPADAEVMAAVRTRLARPLPWRSRHPVLVRAAAAVVAVVVALAALMAVSPPVRAAVLHLLRFAGVEFSSAPAGPLPPSPAPMPGEHIVDLATARRLSAFPILLPAGLGEPEQVMVIDGPPPRVVSLLYRGGTVQLDEFDGDLVFGKMLGGGDVEPTDVAGNPGFWVPKPHEVLYVDRNGSFHSDTARLAGKTLIWQAGGVSLRLEGDFTLEQAKAVGETLR